MINAVAHADEVIATAAHCMSRMGHFQTWARGVARSALPSRTDVASRACQARKVPKAEVGNDSGNSDVPDGRAADANGHWLQE